MKKKRLFSSPKIFGLAEARRSKHEALRSTNEARKKLNLSYI